MHKIIIKLSSLLMLFVMHSSYGQSQSFIWPAFENGKSAIYYSELVNGQWSDQELVVNNGRRNDAPVIASDNLGNQLAVWTYTDGDNNKIAFRYREAGQNWSNVTGLETTIPNNLSPDIKVDNEGRFWMFWVASDQINKDNVYAAYYQNGWKNLTNISDNDQGHDVAPKATLNDNNQLQVRWQFLNEAFELKSKTKALVNNQWIELSSSDAQANSSNMTELSYQDMESLPSAYNEDTAGIGSFRTNDGRTLTIIPNF